MKPVTKLISTLGFFALAFVFQNCGGFAPSHSSMASQSGYAVSNKSIAQAYARIDTYVNAVAAGTVYNDPSDPLNGEISAKLQNCAYQNSQDIPSNFDSNNTPQTFTTTTTLINKNASASCPFSYSLVWSYTVLTSDPNDFTTTATFNFAVTDAELLAEFPISTDTATETGSGTTTATASGNVFNTAATTNELLSTIAEGSVAMKVNSIGAGDGIAASDGSPTTTVITSSTIANGTTYLGTFQYAPGSTPSQGSDGFWTQLPLHSAFFAFQFF